MGASGDKERGKQEEEAVESHDGDVEEKGTELLAATGGAVKCSAICSGWFTVFTNVTRRARTSNNYLRVQSYKQCTTCAKLADGAEEQCEASLLCTTDGRFEQQQDQDTPLRMSPRYGYACWRGRSRDTTEEWKQAS